MKNKIFISVIGLFAFLGFLYHIGSQSQSSVAGIQTVALSPTPLPKPSKVVLPTVELIPTNTPTPTTLFQSSSTQQIQTPSNTSTGLSNNNYYTNVNGNQVHSPAYSTNGNVPAGATAQCGDGTYSFSQHRSGTCSHHGGVTTWY